MPLTCMCVLAEYMDSAFYFMHASDMAHVDVKPDDILQTYRHLDRFSFVIGAFGLACEKFGTGARKTARIRGTFVQRLCSGGEEKYPAESGYIND